MMAKKFACLCLFSVLLFATCYVPCFVKFANAEVECIFLFPFDNTCTLDTTPEFQCVPVSRSSATVNVTLYVDGVASGSVFNHPNYTTVTVVCNRTLAESDVKKPWYFEITDASGTVQTEVRHIGIGAYFTVPAVLVNPNVTTERWTYILNASAFNLSATAITVYNGNITINGQNNVLSGNPDYDGIATSGIDNLEVYNLTLKGWRNGIMIVGTDNIVIQNVITVGNVGSGIVIDFHCSNVTVKNVYAGNNTGHGICFVDDVNCCIAADITASFNGLDGLYFGATNGLALTNITVSHNLGSGVCLNCISNAEIANVTANCNGNGLWLLSAEHVNVTNIHASNNARYGLRVESCVDVKVMNVTADYTAGTYIYDGYGLYVVSSSSLEIADVACNYNQVGLWIELSDFATIVNAAANFNRQYGLALVCSNCTKTQNSSFKENVILDVYFFAHEPLEVEDEEDGGVFYFGGWNHEFINVNVTGNLPIIYYNTTVTLQNWHRNASEIILANADHSTLQNITLTETGNNGILLVCTDHSNLTDIIAANTSGIFLEASHHNQIKNAVLTSASMELTGCTSNMITNVAITGSNGLIIQGSNNNTVSNATITSCQRGITLNGAFFNTVCNSKIQDNTICGVYLVLSMHNLFYNNLFNNTCNVLTAGEESMLNFWNTTKQLGSRIHSAGPYIGGNYWAHPNGTGYSQTCVDADCDGFADFPYIINPDNIDYLPYSDSYLAPAPPKPKLKPAPTPKPEVAVRPENVIAIVAVSLVIVAAIVLLKKGR